MKLKPESEPYSEKYLFKSEIVHDMICSRLMKFSPIRKKKNGRTVLSIPLYSWILLSGQHYIALHQYIKAEPQCKLYPVLLISTACAEVDASARMVVVLFIEHRLSENLFCGFNGRISHVFPWVSEEG